MRFSGIFYWKPTTERGRELVTQHGVGWYSDIATLEKYRVPGAPLAVRIRPNSRSRSAMPLTVWVDARELEACSSVVLSHDVIPSDMWCIENVMYHVSRNHSYALQEKK